MISASSPGTRTRSNAGSWVCASLWYGLAGSVPDGTRAYRSTPRLSSRSGRPCAEPQAARVPDAPAFDDARAQVRIDCRVKGRRRELQRLRVGRFRLYHSSSLLADEADAVGRNAGLDQ